MVEKNNFFEQDKASVTPNVTTASNPMGIDPTLILLKVVKRWPVFVLSTLVALLVVFIYHRYTTEKYRVRGTLAIPEANPNLSAGFLEDFLPAFNANFLNELEVLRSTRIIRDAIEHLDFNVEYLSRGRIKSFEEYRSLPFRIILTEDHEQLYNTEFKISFRDNNQFHLTISSDENHDQSELVPP